MPPALRGPPARRRHLRGRRRPSSHRHFRSRTSTAAAPDADRRATRPDSWRDGDLHQRVQPREHQAVSPTGALALRRLRVRFESSSLRTEDSVGGERSSAGARHCGTRSTCAVRWSSAGPSHRHRHGPTIATPSQEEPCRRPASVIQLGAQHGQDAIDQSGHMHLGDADFVGNLLLGCVMKKT